MIKIQLGEVLFHSFLERNTAKRKNEHNSDFMKSF